MQNFNIRGAGQCQRGMRLVLRILITLATTTALAPRPSTRRGGIVAQASKPELGFSFTPGGLLFPYYIGLAYELQRNGIITTTSPLAGSSAGSIVAGALACGVPEDEVIEALRRLADEYREGGSLNLALRKQLARMLPDDAAERVTASRSLTICYQQILPWPKACLVESYKDKQDLIDVICASCCWPWFLSRWWPCVWVRGGLGLDGWFAVPRAQFGAPDLDGEAERTLRLSALPRVSVSPGSGGLIQPGQPVADAPGAPTYELPMSDSNWFNWALRAAPEATLDEMRECGRRHAQMWLRQHAEQKV